MRKFIAILLILSLAKTAFAFDELWQRAQRLAENSWRILPGKVTLNVDATIERRNQKAGIEVEVLFASKFCEDNQIRFELISTNYIIDVPEEMEYEYEYELEDYLEELYELKKEFDDIDYEVDTSDAGTLEENSDFDDLIRQLIEKELSERGNTPSRTGVFFETNTRRLRVRRLNEQREINGRISQAFDVRYTPGGRRRDREEGKVWLDIQTGAPVLSEFSPSRTPMFIRSAERREYFSFNDESKQFYTTKIVESSVLSMLGIRMTIITTTLTDEHWEFPIIDN